jgi:hypothetical protein
MLKNETPKSKNVSPEQDDIEDKWFNLR